MLKCAETDQLNAVLKCAETDQLNVTLLECVVVKVCRDRSAQWNIVLKCAVLERQISSMEQTDRLC